MTHTPGPWAVADEPNGGRIYIRCAYEGECDIAEIATEDVGTEVSHAQALADAHLIAAAPRMLEALRDALAELEDRDCPCVDGIRAAIAAAEGRTE